jgi:hypothetical protein
MTQDSPFHDDIAALQTLRQRTQHLKDQLSLLVQHKQITTDEAQSYMTLLARGESRLTRLDAISELMNSPEDACFNTETDLLDLLLEHGSISSEKMERLLEKRAAIVKKHLTLLKTIHKEFCHDAGSSLIAWLNLLQKGRMARIIADLTAQYRTLESLSLALKQQVAPPLQTSSHPADTERMWRGMAKLWLYFDGLVSFIHNSKVSLEHDQPRASGAARTAHPGYPPDDGESQEIGENLAQTASPSLHPPR